MTHRLRTIWSYVALAAITALALAVMLAEPWAPTFADQGHVIWLLSVLPWVLLPAVALLGLRVNQTRVFFVAGLTLICYALVDLAGRGRLGLCEVEQVCGAVAVSYPLGAWAVLRMREGRLFGLAGLLRLLACVCPLAVLLYAASPPPSEPVAGLLYRWPPLGDWWGLPLLTVPVYAGLGVALWLGGRGTNGLFRRASVFTFVPLLTVLNLVALGLAAEPGHDAAIGLGFSAVALLLSYTLYHTYWEKAYVDELTGLPNRRALNEKLHGLGRHYSVAMIDIDYFKAFNDTYGHGQGDTVLRYVARHLERAFGGNAFRYGGEEFCVLFDGTSIRQAARQVESTRQLVGAKDFYIRSPDEVRRHTSPRDRGAIVGSVQRAHLAFSAGIAYRDLDDETPQDMIEMADKALYWAKRAGRNRIICYAEDRQPEEEMPQ
jgi:diguanylate cyclase (GGDEF)-like protein